MISACPVLFLSSAAGRPRGIGMKTVCIIFSGEAARLYQAGNCMYHDLFFRSRE